MTISGNKTSKIYQDLRPEIPQKTQPNHLEKLTETEVDLLDEIEDCERLAQKWVFNKTRSFSFYYWGGGSMKLF